jgi:hypothetical protein
MLSIGQTIYYSERGKICEKTISRVGKKYFYVDGFRNQFYIDNLREKTKFGCGSRVYLSAQEIIDEKESEVLHRKIMVYFQGFGRSKFTLDQLRAIDKIIREKDCNINESKN